MSLTITCRRCGQPMPEIDEDLQAAVLAGRAVVPGEHAPGQCPGEAGERQADGGERGHQPGLRFFEARMTVVEVFPGGRGQPARREPEVLGEFAATATAKSAADAIAPGGRLAVELGQKWQRMHEHIGIADLPDDVPMQSERVAVDGPHAGTPVRSALILPPGVTR